MNDVVVQERQGRVVVHNAVPLFDTQSFDHMTRVAGVMARASLIPTHLIQQTYEGTVANCFLIVNQAMRWDMDPFALAQGCFVLHGKLGFEGKVIAAMIEAKIGASLDYEWEGEPGTDKFTVTVSGPRMTDRKVVSISGSVGDWKTYEKDGRTVKMNWRGLASRNQLAYRGAREWARLYAPALMLGVYTPDDLEDMHAEHRMRDITDYAPPSSDEPKRSRGRPKKDPEQTNRFQDDDAGKEQTAEDEVTRADGGADIKTTHTNIKGTENEDPPSSDEDASDEQAETGAQSKTVEKQSDGGANQERVDTDAAKPEKDKNPAAAKKSDGNVQKSSGSGAASDKKTQPETKTETTQKPMTLGEISPGIGDLKSDVAKFVIDMHDDMNKVQVNDKELLRAIWVKHTYPGQAQKPYPVIADKHFEAIKRFHVDRIAKIKDAPAEQTKDDGFDSPPSPDDDEPKKQVDVQDFNLEQFTADLKTELEALTTEDEVTEFFNSAVEVPRRAKVISEQDYQDKLVPMMLAVIEAMG